MRSDQFHFVDNVKPTIIGEFKYNKTFVNFLIVFLIPITIIYLLSIAYGTGELSVKNILFTLSNTDMTTLFREDIQHFRDLYTLFQNGTANLTDIFRILWTLINLIFDFGYNIVNTIWTLLKTILVIIGGI